MSRNSPGRGDRGGKYDFRPHAKRRPSRTFTAASPVKVTHPDGTITTQPAYTPAELNKIANKAKKRRRS